MTIELDEGAVNRTGSAPSLYYASAMPTGSAKAVLGIIPGYADHGARYAHVMGALAEHGIGSVAVDLRGHGRAQGTRGSATASTSTSTTRASCVASSTGARRARPHCCSDIASAGSWPP